MSRFLSFMTLAAVGGVGVGTAALIIAFAVLDGFEDRLRDNITGFSAHVQAGTFRNQIVPDDTGRLHRILGTPHVRRALPTLQREAVLITRDDIDGVKVKGMGGEEVDDLVRARIIAGEARRAPKDGKPSLLVGSRLAQRLNLSVGRTVVLLGVMDVRDVLNAPKVPFVIRGIYETGMAEYYDDVFVFTDLGSAQSLFGLPGMINGYDVRCETADQSEAVASVLQNRLGYPFDPLSVFTIFRNLFVWIDLQKELIPVVVGSLIFIAAFNVISTLLLFVMEKTRQIGVLRALGASRRTVVRIFLSQGLFIGLAGVALGSVLAYGFCAAQLQWEFFRLPPDVYFMTSVPISLSLARFLVVGGIAVGLTVASSLIPAWLAARLRPLTTIRFH